MSYLLERGGLILDKAIIAKNEKYLPSSFLKIRIRPPKFVVAK
jgi:hypothetical protein